MDALDGIPHRGPLPPARRHQHGGLLTAVLHAVVKLWLGSKQLETRVEIPVLLRIDPNRSKYGDPKTMVSGEEEEGPACPLVRQLGNTWIRRRVNEKMTTEGLVKFSDDCFSDDWLLDDCSLDVCSFDSDGFLSTMSSFRSCNRNLPPHE